MPHPLNLTVKLKQDPESLAKLEQFKKVFATAVQPRIEKIFQESEIVHFARVLVIDDKYIQVLTEYDGDKQEYTEFFRSQLPDVFEAIFSLVEDAPPWSELQDPNAFYNFGRSHNLKGLGEGGDPEEGYLFSAFGNTTVKQLKEALTAGAGA